MHGLCTRVRVLPETAAQHSYNAKRNNSQLKKAYLNSQGLKSAMLKLCFLQTPSKNKQNQTTQKKKHAKNSEVGVGLV